MALNAIYPLRILDERNHQESLHKLLTWNIIVFAHLVEIYCLNLYLLKAFNHFCLSELFYPSTDELGSKSTFTDENVRDARYVFLIMVCVTARQTKILTNLVSGIEAFLLSVEWNFNYSERFGTQKVIVHFYRINITCRLWMQNFIWCFNISLRANNCINECQNFTRTHFQSIS